MIECDCGSKDHAGFHTETCAAVKDAKVRSLRLVTLVDGPYGGDSVAIALNAVMYHIPTTEGTHTYAAMVADVDAFEYIGIDD